MAIMWSCIEVIHVVFIAQYADIQKWHLAVLTLVWQVTQRTYEHIAESGRFDDLRSTRHFGPMTFYLTIHRKIDSLLIDMLHRHLWVLVGVSVNRWFLCLHQCSGWMGYVTFMSQSVCLSVYAWVCLWTYFHQTFSVGVFWDKDECFKCCGQEVKVQGHGGIIPGRVIEGGGSIHINAWMSKYLLVELRIFNLTINYSLWLSSFSVLVLVNMLFLLSVPVPLAVLRPSSACFDAIDWLGGVMVKALDLQSSGCGFDSWPGCYQAT